MSYSLPCTSHSDLNDIKKKFFHIWVLSNEQLSLLISIMLHIVSDKELEKFIWPFC